MEAEIGQAVLTGSSSAQDFSIIGMFMTATITVKIVIIMLLAASVWCWAIILEKSRRFRKVRSQAEKFEEQFWSGKPLDELYARIGEKPGHPMAALFVAAMKEWQRASERGGMKPNLPERVHKVMAVTLSREMERLEKYLGVLATVGSTAPFVGLFGTVWGIMNSFQSIAQSNNTSLAVVAPGIAEALFATALGLIAAIPAVIAYNKFSGDLARYANRLEGFAEEFNAILVRQIEDGNH
ncbi:MAG: protein TolQ [Alphaproteobacteria bacterium]